MVKRKRINKAKVKAQKADDALRRLVVSTYEVAPIYLDQLNEGKQEQLGIELYDAVHDAAKLYITTYKPRGVDQRMMKGGWLSHGVRIKSERHKAGTAVVSDDKTHRGETHYYCLFCSLNLLTFGWNDGVRTMPPALIDKLYTHVNWCAMQFVRRFVEGNDEGYRYAYHPDPENDRPCSTTRTMIEMKLHDDRALVDDALAIKMVRDKSLVLDFNGESRDS